MRCRAYCQPFSGPVVRVGCLRRFARIVPEEWSPGGASRRQNPAYRPADTCPFRPAGSCPAHRRPPLHVGRAPVSPTGGAASHQHAMDAGLVVRRRRDTTPADGPARDSSAGGNCIEPHAVRRHSRDRPREALRTRREPATATMRRRFVGLPGKNCRAPAKPLRRRASRVERPEIARVSGNAILG